MIIAYFLWIVLSIIVGFIGKNRKFGFWGYLFASILFTPVIGLVLVVASDPREPSYRA